MCINRIIFYTTINWAPISAKCFTIGINNYMIYLLSRLWICWITFVNSNIVSNRVFAA